MSRIQPVDIEKAEGKQKEALEKVKAKAGRVSNIFKVMAHAPAAVEMYFGMSAALGSSTLPLKTRERIALVVAEDNQCAYCLAAHTAIAKNAGLTPDEILTARGGKAADPKEDAIVRLAKKVSAKRGNLTDGDVAEARKMGITDEETVETIAAVSINLFTNYINHVADTAIDFPKVSPLS